MNTVCLRLTVSFRRGPWNPHSVSRLANQGISSANLPNVVVLRRYLSDIPKVPPCASKLSTLLDSPASPTVGPSLASATEGETTATPQKPMPITRFGKVFYPIYYWPYTLYVRAYARFKLYQILFLSVAGLANMGMAALGYEVSQGVIAAFAVSNLIASAILYTTSILFSKWIGRMYLDESGTDILISHLTFWGNRNDFLMKVNDVMPLDQLPESNRNLWIKFRRLDIPKDYYYFSLWGGGILDEEGFCKVFGDAHRYMTSEDPIPKIKFRK